MEIAITLPEGMPRYKVNIDWTESRREIGVTWFHGGRS